MSNRVKINNHMQRILPLRRPYPKGDGGSKLVLPLTAFNSQTVIIQPGKSETIDFWDAIKDHPIYQNYLDRGLITVGEDDTLERGGSEPFTSFGDTLEAADSLDPEIDDEEAEKLQMDLQRGEEAQPKRRRRTKAQMEADSAASQNFEQN